MKFLILLLILTAGISHTQELYTTNITPITNITTNASASNPTNTTPYIDTRDLSSEAQKVQSLMRELQLYGAYNYQASSSAASAAAARQAALMGIVGAGIIVSSRPFIRPRPVFIPVARPPIGRPPVVRAPVRAPARAPVRAPAGRLPARGRGGNPAAAIVGATVAAAGTAAIISSSVAAAQQAELNEANERRIQSAEDQIRSIIEGLVLSDLDYQAAARAFDQTNSFSSQIQSLDAALSNDVAILSDRSTLMAQEFASYTNQLCTELAELELSTMSNISENISRMTSPTTEREYKALNKKLESALKTKQKQTASEIKKAEKNYKSELKSAEKSTPAIIEKLKNENNQKVAALVTAYYDAQDAILQRYLSLYAGRLLAY